jgi:hypothetical protein
MRVAISVFQFFVERMKSLQKDLGLRRILTVKERCGTIIHSCLFSFGTKDLYHFAPTGAVRNPGDLNA